MPRDDQAVRATLRTVRRFICNQCRGMRTLTDWASRPSGWFLIYPPGESIVADPLEVQVCSERCAILWLQARVKARMIAAPGGY